MKQTEGTFKGLKDLDLYYQAWLPDKDPKAVLLVVHGLAEHIGRYKNLVNYFVPAAMPSMALTCGGMVSHRV